MNRIRFFVFDVDGTLTDGKIYMGEDGELFKAFSVKDGAGISLLLPDLEIIPIVITARESRILEKRCKELGIKEIFQNSMDKLKILTNVVSKYGEKLNAVAYAGDDLPDLPCMEMVKKKGGIVLAPCDAINEVKLLADYISKQKAGDGAVRDMIEWLQKSQKKAKIDKEIEEISDWVLSHDFSRIEPGCYHLRDGVDYSIQNYSTRSEDECALESHRNHIDIQYIITGQEKINLYKQNNSFHSREYDNTNDIEYWQEAAIDAQHVLVPGSLIVIYNGVIHKGAIRTNCECDVKKCVVKILIN